MDHNGTATNADGIGTLGPLAPNRSQSSRPPDPSRLAPGHPVPGTPGGIYTVPEVAAYLRVSLSHVKAALRRGELRSFTYGRRRLVARQDLDAFVDHLRAEAER